MESAAQLFNTLQSFKTPHPGGKPPHDRLIDYCKNVLGIVERQYFDYKSKSDARNPQLSVPDKTHLAKAISGFANSDGGVLIWGIDDETLLPKPISHVQTFVANILQLAPRCTAPPVPGIDGSWIPSNPTNDEGFALIYIPESPLPPHQVILQIQDIQNHYYMRIGQNFQRAHHVNLEDMFGRRPHPILSLTTKVIRGARTGIARVILGIKNDGRGVAKYPFLSVSLNQPYVISPDGIDGTGTIRLPLLSGGPQRSTASYGASVTKAIHPSIEHEVTSIEGRFPPSARPVDVPDLTIKYTLIAEGVSPVEGEKVIPGSEMF